MDHDRPRAPTHAAPDGILLLARPARGEPATGRTHPGLRPLGRRRCARRGGHPWRSLPHGQRGRVGLPRRRRGADPRRSPSLRSPSTGDRSPTTPSPPSSAATGHRTEAERFGWSFVFGGLLPDDFPDTRGRGRRPRGGARCSGRTGATRPGPAATWPTAATTRWCTCRGTTPRPSRPGPGSDCPPRRSGSARRRGGLEGAAFPWGDEREPGGEHRMNVWQGEFPNANSLADGYLGTSPVGAYPPNGLGLVDATGNVWEWVGDWFALEHPAARRDRPHGAGRRARRGSSAAGPTCATTPTAGATGWPPARARPRTPPPATSASAARCDLLSATCRWPGRLLAGHGDAEALVGVDEVVVVVVAEVDLDPADLPGEAAGPRRVGGR